MLLVWTVAAVSPSCVCVIMNAEVVAVDACAHVCVRVCIRVSISSEVWSVSGLVGSHSAKMNRTKPAKPARDYQNVGQRRSNPRNHGNARLALCPAEHVRS